MTSEKTKNSHDLVTIITIVLNGSNHIEQTIRSVINQTYSPIEYIVIDGGSKDGTQSIIERYRDRIDNFVSEPDHGIYDAINKGISKANGSLIGLIHCGDYYDPDAVSYAVNAYQEKTADIIYGDIRFIENEGANQIIRVGFSDHKKMLQQMSIFHPATFVSHSCYHKHGLYDSRYRLAPDYDFFLRLFLSGVQFYRVDKVMVSFRTGGSSGTNFKLSMEENIAIRKHHLGTISAHICPR